MLANHSGLTRRFDCLCFCGICFKGGHELRAPPLQAIRLEFPRTTMLANSGRLTRGLSLVELGSQISAICRYVSKVQRDNRGGQVDLAELELACCK
jgi:hypothetical protein